MTCTNHTDPRGSHLGDHSFERRGPGTRKTTTLGNRTREGPRGESGKIHKRKEMSHVTSDHHKNKAERKIKGEVGGRKERRQTRADAIGGPFRVLVPKDR